MNSSYQKYSYVTRCRHENLIMTELPEKDTDDLQNRVVIKTENPYFTELNLHISYSAFYKYKKFSHFLKY